MLISLKITSKNRIEVSSKNLHKQIFLGSHSPALEVTQLKFHEVTSNLHIEHSYMKVQYNKLNVQ